MKDYRASLKMKTIGLVLDFFNPELLGGAHTYAKENGLLLDARWSVRGDWTPQKPEWDGIIYAIVDHPKLAKRIKSWKIPKLSLMPDTNEDWKVDPDYERCGVMAAKEMLKSGVQHLMNVTVSTRKIDLLFSKGVSRVAEENAIPCSTIVTEQARLSLLLDQLMSEIKSQPSPLGICLPHAGIAYGLQKELLKDGIHIPEDVAMIVIDKDVQRTPSLAPVPLTTIELNEWHRGFVAAEMLHHLMQDTPLPQQHIIIPPKGITRRASTGHQEVHDRVVGKALSYLRKNYLKPIDVADVVATVGVSRRVVEMRFRQVLNRGIHEELSRLRIVESKRRIMNRDTTITAIAEACGFSSVHYFSAAFKKETGCSPKQYQKQKNST